jgi:hypothetical protein
MNNFGAMGLRFGDKDSIEKQSIIMSKLPDPILQIVSGSSAITQILTKKQLYTSTRSYDLFYSW